MSKTNDLARRRAQAIWETNKQQGVDARRLRQRAEASKTARLRELRLAKEAADREIERLDAQRRQRPRKPRLSVLLPKPLPRGTDGTETH